MDKYVLGVSKGLGLSNYSNLDKIRYLMRKNRGYITTKEISNNKIARDYLKVLVDDGSIRNIARGIYIDAKIVEDTLYSFQLKYPKIIYSHFTSLNLLKILNSKNENNYFTCVNNFYKDDFKNNNVFYVKNEWLDLGLIEYTTKQGNMIRIYDIERSICDIVRSRKRLDLELVKKCVRKYMKTKDKDIKKLLIYAKKMNMYDDMVEFTSLVL